MQEQFLGQNQLQGNRTAIVQNIRLPSGTQPTRNAAPPPSGITHRFVHFELKDVTAIGISMPYPWKRKYRGGRRGRLDSLLVLVIIMQSACGGAESFDVRSAERLIHPTPDGLPLMDLNVQRLQRKPPVASAMSEGFAFGATEHQLRIGYPSGPPGRMIGHVEDAVSLSDGRIVVLDSRLNRLYLYANDGRLIAAGGGPGRSPGRFMAPDKLAVDGRNRVGVVDRYRTLQVWQVGLNGLTFERSVNLPFVPESICAMRDRFVLQGASETGGILHTYSADGNHLHSFGLGYQSNSKLVRDMLSDGIVACETASQTILLSFPLFPVIYGYNLDGTVRWVAAIDEFHTTRIVQESIDGRSTVSFEAADTVRSIVLEMTPLHRNNAMVQVAHRTRSDASRHKPYSRLDSYEIDTDTGRGRYLGKHMPPVLFASKQRLGFRKTEPFPHLMTVARPYP